MWFGSALINLFLSAIQSDTCPTCFSENGKLGKELTDGAADGYFVIFQSSIIWRLFFLGELDRFAWSVEASVDCTTLIERHGGRLVAPVSYQPSGVSRQLANKVNSRIGPMNETYNEDPVECDNFDPVHWAHRHKWHSAANWRVRCEPKYLQIYSVATGSLHHEPFDTFPENLFGRPCLLIVFGLLSRLSSARRAQLRPTSPCPKDLLIRSTFHVSFFSLVPYLWLWNRF